MASSGAGEVKPRVTYGGPYLGESAKIEAELLRRHNAGEDKPSKNDLLSLFVDSGISEGGLKLIDTHVDGHPMAGYEGERYYATSEAHGVEPVEKPAEDYVFPGEGGTNIEDDYGDAPLGYYLDPKTDDGKPVETPAPDYGSIKDVIADLKSDVPVPSVEEAHAIVNEEQQP